MALYFLSYDLRKQKDYKKLLEELESFYARRVLLSLWSFQRFDTSCKGLRDHFLQFIDQDDGLIVIEASNWGYL